MITQVKLQNLSEIKIGWFCVALFEGTSPLENASTLMVCLGKKKLGSTSPCIVPRLVTHMKHLHACFAEISSFVFSQPQENLDQCFLQVLEKINGLSHQITDYSEISQIMSPLLSTYNLGFIIIYKFSSTSKQNVFMPHSHLLPSLKQM